MAGVGLAREAGNGVRPRLDRTGVGRSASRHKRATAKRRGEVLRDAKPQIRQPVCHLWNGIQPPLSDGRQEHRILRCPHRPGGIVVQEHVVDHNPPPLRQAVGTAGQQPAAVGDIPIVEDIGKQVGDTRDAKILGNGQGRLVFSSAE